MARLLLFLLTVGAAAFVAAALLRPVPEVGEIVGTEGEPLTPIPVRLRGRAPEPIPPPGEDLATALSAARGENDLGRLEHWAIHADDARVRREAIRRLVALRGEAARGFLLSRVADVAESSKVRAECARLLGRVGTLADLEDIVDGSLPRRVRQGAAAGLVELEEDQGAAVRLDQLLHGHEHQLRRAVVGSLTRSRSTWSHRLATGYVADPTLEPSSRAALARSLGAQKVETARPALEAVLATDQTAPEVRAAAAEALGILGNPEARTVLASVGDDAPDALRRAVTVAQQRLDRRATERR